MPLIAEIAVSGTTYSFDMLFSYNVPVNMRIYEGCRVLVPFGIGNRRRVGVVMYLKENTVSSLKSLKSSSLLFSNPLASLKYSFVFMLIAGGSIVLTASK